MTTQPDYILKGSLYHLCLAYAEARGWEGQRQGHLAEALHLSVVHLSLPEGSSLNLLGS